MQNVQKQSSSAACNNLLMLQEESLPLMRGSLIISLWYPKAQLSIEMGIGQRHHFGETGVDWLAGSAIISEKLVFIPLTLWMTWRMRTSAWLASIAGSSARVEFRYHGAPGCPDVPCAPRHIRAPAFAPWGHS